MCGLRLQEIDEMQNPDFACRGMDRFAIALSLCGALVRSRGPT